MLTDVDAMVWLGVALATVLFPFVLLYSAKIIGFGLAAGWHKFLKRKGD